MTSIVSEIIGRLTDVCSGRFGLVEGAAQLASLGTGRPTAMPAAYVFVKEEAAGQNERTVRVLQRVEMDLGVVLVAENVSDARGDAASDEIEGLKAAVKAALIGWQPASAEDVVTYGAGQLVRARDGLVWWELTFATATYEEG